MNSEFLPEAEGELREATRYYESEAPGVGMAFVAEVRRAVRAIIENPYVAEAVGSGIRGSVLNHFPYSVLYVFEPDLILIVAVTHQKRRPKYWKARIKQIKEQKDQTTG